ncbi:MAG: archease, partial [Candidatus Woesearchaeota archaeon]
KYNFRYFDHTADAMFEGYGKTIEEAFSNCALAMFNILTDIKKVKPLKKINFSVKADKYEKLLFDFLDELLFYLDTEHLIFSKFNIKILEKDNIFFLNCDAFGDDIKNYERHGDIKAPTYNEMLIKKEKNKWIVRAVVDI